MKADVIVAGGGVAGLAAARKLKQLGLEKIVVLELEENAGGSSISGKNAGHSYPWGAHYVPLPGKDCREVLEFFQEINLIQGHDAAGRPVYDELALCHDPQERLFMHAQKDMKVEIENALTTTVKASHEVHTLEKGDRTVDVQTGKEVHKVKGTREVEVTGNETHTDKADFTHKVTGNYELKVTGNLVIDVTGSITIKGAKDVGMKAGTTLQAEAGTALTNKAGTALTNQAGTSLTNKASLDLTNQAGTGLKNKAGTTLDNEGAMVTNKASAMQTVDGGGMLTLKGGLVKIN